MVESIIFKFILPACVGSIIAFICALVVFFAAAVGCWYYDKVDNDEKYFQWFDYLSFGWSWVKGAGIVSILMILVGALLYRL